MALRSLDEIDAIEWIFLTLTLALAGIHLYLGLLAPFVAEARAVQFVVIGLAFLVGPMVYITPYWRPVLYLLGIGLALYFGTIWVLGGMELLRFGAVTGLVAICFVIVAFYLFLREEFRRTG